MDKDVIIALSNALQKGQSVALIMIVDQQGSSPRHNASMLIDDKGKIIAGTIGGGGIEKKGIEEGLIAIKERKNALHHYHLNMSKDDPKALQMACGGGVSIYIKPYFSDKRIVVVGGGHISLALSQLAHTLGYRYAVIDDRAEYASLERFSNAQTVVASDIIETLKSFETSEEDAFVIVSHDHIHDLDALKILKDKPHFYLGMIGSKEKVAYTYKQMKEAGLDYDESLIYAPIGLDIGGETPEEIALSIMAEIQSVRYKKKVISLKDKQ